MGSPTPAGPLSEADFQGIKDQLAALDVADKEIAKAERAGLDMTEQKKTSASQRVQLRKLLQTYFPGRI